MTEAGEFAPPAASKKRKTAPRGKTTEKTESVPLKNSFEVLSDAEENMEEEPGHASTSISAPRVEDAKKANFTQNTAINPKKPPRIVPIIKDKSKWMNTSKLIKKHNINTTKCKAVSSGIQIEPASEDDYRKLKKLFENQKIEFYTYQLRSEKRLKVVIRGVTQEITEKEVADDLEVTQ